MAGGEWIESDLVRYREYAPPVRLAGWVECFWTGEVEESVRAAPVRPDGCVDIVYSRSEGLRAVGAMTTAQRYDRVPGTFHCGVRFLSGMTREFLKTSMRELTDRNVALEDVAGRLACVLAGPVEDAADARSAVQAMGANLPTPQSAKSAAQRAIAALTAANGASDLDGIVRESNMSARHFRRLCVEESGLSPKHLVRILRFRRALQLAIGPAPDWADIALAAGYFDQSHMIRDFREFSGETPMAVFSNRSADALA